MELEEFLGLYVFGADHARGMTVVTKNFYLPLIQTLQAAFDQMQRTNSLNFNTLFAGTEEQFEALGFRTKQKRGIENILINDIVDVMGDFILKSGFIRELRANHPSARITLLVNDYTYPLAALCPYVNEVLHCDVRVPPTADMPLRLLMKTAEFAANNLWQRHFTTSICPQPGGFKLPPLFMSYFSGAAERIGYSDQNNVGNMFFNRPIECPKEVGHEAARAFYILTANGLKVHSTNLELWYDAADILSVERFLSALAPDKKRITIGLGAGNVNRKYPAAQYVEALKEIEKRGANFVLVGGTSEADDARVIEKGLAGRSVVNLVGRLNLRETTAAIAMTDMYIGNDSGAMHAAAAAHIPVIAIWREARDKANEFIERGLPSEYHMFSPWQTQSIVLRPEHPLDECQDTTLYGGCRYYERQHCIAQVQPREIVEAYDKILGG